MTKYVWDSIEEIDKRLINSPHILLLLDYDGTLAEIVKTPDEAKLPTETKNLLKKLLDSKRITLGILSGRDISNIKKHIGIENIIYSGNHGLEWEIEGNKYMAPGLKSAVALYPEILAKLKVFADSYKGVQIQDKKLTIAIHYRLLDESEKSKFKDNFNAVIEPYIASSMIKLLKGKKVYDIRPNLTWNKGTFAKWLINKKNTPLVTICIGDDRTDEEAFVELKDSITIKVGSGETAARYFLKNLEDTVAFLEWILSKNKENP